MILCTLTVTQEVLAELDWLRKEAKKARRAYDTARSYVRAVLLRGAEVEPGPYEVQIAIQGRLVIE